jgi:hypothetical protein
MAGLAVNAFNFKVCLKFLHIFKIIINQTVFTWLAYEGGRESFASKTSFMFFLGCFISFKFTLKTQKINPYKAGPIPLHNPLMPVIIPCETPCESAWD